MQNTPRPVGYEPTQIATETFLIRTAFASAGDAMTMYQSSMLIRAVMT